MARARIVYTWDDGDSLRCEVEADTSYPDALNQAKAECVAMFATALGVSVATLADESKAGE